MRLLLISTLLIVFQFGFAQHYLPQNISTPYGNVVIPGHGFPNFNYFYNSNMLRSLKHEFTIELLDSTLITSATRIKFDDSTSYLEFKKDKEKIRILPNQTKGIYRFTSSGRKLLGIPQDSCWLFLLNKSKISTYSITSELDLLAFETHVQKGDEGSIVEITKENLEAMVHDHPKALALVKKRKLLKAIKVYNKVK